LGTFSLSREAYEKMVNEALSVFEKGLR